MRLSVVAACLSLCLIGFSSADDAHASIRKETNIPAEGLGPALNALAKDRNFQIVYVTEEIANVRTEGAVGELTTDEALKRLLNGTGLTHRYLDDRTVTIGSPITPQGHSDRASKTTSTSSDEANSPEEGKKSSSGGFRLAQVDQGKSSGVSSLGNQTSNSQENSTSVSAGLSEIIVTAQKREERLQDVPVPVTVIRAESLSASNQPRLEDYYTKIPGLSLTLLGNGDVPSVSIRGLTTGGNTNPTVGIVVDDVPYGASISPGISPSAPDIDPADLARVEVLRGPQGTLYGADSIGGLLKFVTVDPSTEAVSGHIQAGFSDVRYGGDLGYVFRGGVNVPLSDSLAVRASAFKEVAPGYIDNIQAGQPDANRRDNYGGRLSSLWRPSETFSLKLSALLQHSDRAGQDETDARLGSQLAYNALPNSGGYDRDTQAYSATINAKLGKISLVSATGYNVDKVGSDMDATLISGGLFSKYANMKFGVTGSVEPVTTKTNKFTQEVRLSIPLAERLDWMIGGFYTDEKIVSGADFLAANASTGAVAGTLLALDIPSSFDEYAAFTDFTYHATDRFDVQFGGRWSENTQTFTTTRSGVLVPVFYGGVSVVPEVHSKDTPVTYLVTPRFRVSPDLMVYARLASGYRPGGPNVSCGAPGVPQCQYDADKTQNYEIGVKGDLWERNLSFDASAYYIDWKNVQIAALTPTGLSYRGNDGRAKSQGVELSLEARPYDGLTVSAWIAVNDAKLTAVPPTSTLGGAPGDRLPYSSPFSGNLSLNQKFPLGTNTTGFIGGSLSYVGDRKGQFSQTARATFPGYMQADLLAGVEHGSWTLDTYVNNVADKRGVLKSGALDSLLPYYVTYIRPRTIGLSLTKSF